MGNIADNLERDEIFSWFTSIINMQISTTKWEQIIKFLFHAVFFFSFIITWVTTMMQVSLNSIKLKAQKDSMSYLVLDHSIQASGIVLLENKDGLPTGHVLPILSWDDAMSTS